jgi:hypothetical protein
MVRIPTVLRLDDQPIKIQKRRGDFDSLDLIVCVALAGGFMTGEWMPFAVIFFFVVSADIIAERNMRR